MDQVLFCPFCGEAFEGLSRCPEHELLLVPWRELSPQSAAAERTLLPWYSARFGRGMLATGAALSLLAFLALPLAQVEGALSMGGSLLRLSLTSAPKLWLVPAAAIAELLILHRRRSVHSLRGARIAASFLACVPCVAVYMTWRGAHQAVRLLAERTQQPLHMHVGAGAVVVALSGALMLIGALRLGSGRVKPGIS